MTMKKIGILISGRGSNMLALIRAVADGRIPGAEVAIVISNVENAASRRRTRRRPVALDHREDARRTRPGDGRRIARLRSRSGLSGRLCATALALVHARVGGILNIHPSLLPAFPGLAQRQAIEYGSAGCTVHLVDEELDHGPIVKQAAVPVTRRY